MKHMKQMIQDIILTRSLLAWAAVLSMGDQSHATIRQSVHASYAPSTTGSVTVADDSFDAPPDSPRNLLAQIGGTRYGASSSAGTFGNVGMEGHLLTRGSQQTSLTISSDEFINPTGIPSRAQANFIIDGGELTFLADGNLLFTLQLGATISDRDGNAVDHSIWNSFAFLDPGPAGTELTINGNDIGIEMVNSISARIPLSFQTFDIGTVPAGGSLSLSYHAQIFASGPQFVEIISWRFSDPLSIDGPGEFPTVTFEAVPEPASGLLAGAAAVAAQLFRRRFSRERFSRTPIL